MIVQQLGAATDDNKSDYWYQQGAHWWNEHGQNVGELDLVVYHKKRGVVAISEMKSSCFEIAMAPRQHESKLKAVAASSNDKWAIGKTFENAINVSGSDIPFFIATILPNNDETDGRTFVGVEPLIANAICSGIRHQHCQIVHPSNLLLCKPLADMLTYTKNLCVGDAVRYLETLQPPCCGQELQYNDNLDLFELRCFVLNRMDGQREQTSDDDGDDEHHSLNMESPLACLKRFPNIIIF